MLNSLYKKIDASANGIVGFSEMREWMTGRARRQALARDVRAFSRASLTGLTTSLTTCLTTCLTTSQRRASH